MRRVSTAMHKRARLFAAQQSRRTDFRVEQVVRIQLAGRKAGQLRHLVRRHLEARPFGVAIRQRQLVQQRRVGRVEMLRKALLRAARRDVRNRMRLGCVSNR